MIGENYDERGEADAVAKYQSMMEAEAKFLRQVELGEEARRRQTLLEAKATAALKEQEAAQLRALAAGQRAAAQVTAFGNVMADVFGGRLAGALRGAGGMLHNFATARAAGKGGGDWMATLASAAGGAASALAGVVTAGKAMIDTVITMGTASSPGLGKAFGDAKNLLMAELGKPFVPLLAHLSAGFIVLADTLKPATDALANWTAGLGEVGTKKLAAGVVSPAFALGADPFMDVVDSMKRFATGGDARFVPRGSPGGPDSIFKSSGTTWEDALKKVANAARVHSGQGQPAFEGVDNAFKRIQQATAGMTDPQRETLDVNRKMLDVLDKIAEYTGFSAGKKEDAGGGGNW